MRRKPVGYILHFRLHENACIEYLSVGNMYIAPTWWGNKPGVKMAAYTPRQLGPESGYANSPWHKPTDGCVTHNPFETT